MKKIYLTILMLVLVTNIINAQLASEPQDGSDMPPLFKCTEDAKICSDGSAVQRDPANNCEFKPCPIVACTEIYQPVCGQPPMPECPPGAYCKMVMPPPKTYSNMCELENAGAEFLYNGVCKTLNSCDDSDGGKNYFEKGTISSCPSSGLGACKSRTDICDEIVKTSESDAMPGREFLREHYCSNGEIDFLEYTCKNGCFDGACIKDQGVQVIYPNGGEELVKGKNYEIKWTGGHSDQTDPGERGIALKLVKAKDNTQVGWINFGGPAKGSYNWDPSKVMSSIYHGYNTDVPDGEYKIQALDYNHPDGEYQASDYSDKSFKIISQNSICKDSDDGKNYYKKGKTSYCPSSEYDACVSVTDYCSRKTLTEGYCDGNVKTVQYICPDGCVDGACVQQNDFSYSINTDKSVYLDGNTVKITGKVSGKTAAAKVKAIVLTPENNVHRVSMTKTICAVTDCALNSNDCNPLTICSYEGKYVIGSIYVIEVPEPEEDALVRQAEFTTESDATRAKSSVSLDKYLIVSTAVMNGDSKGDSANFYVESESCNTNNDCPQIQCIKAPCPYYECRDGDCVKYYSCTEEYSPVCGQPPMPKCSSEFGCAQVMPQPKTYSNMCELEKAHAEFLYKGECDAKSVCKDSDGGKNYYVKGTMTICPSSISDSDSNGDVFGCTTHYDYCSDNTLHEANCEVGSLTYSKYFCENGCNDGACKREIPVECKSDNDCPNLQCFKAPCPYYSCSNNVCELNEPIEECVEECRYKGTRSEGIYDSCTDELISYGCGNQECNGCTANGSCLNYGTRLAEGGEPRYCDILNTWLRQKEENIGCQNNYECESNSCLSGVCTDLKQELQETQSLVKKLFNWLKNLFG